MLVFNIVNMEFKHRTIFPVFVKREKEVQSKMEKKTLILGVIGSDVHAVGNKILYHAFTEAGFEVVNLGVMVSQEEFIAAAVETKADAIVIGSLYGQGELDCRGLREKCVEAGIGEIPLLIGGNIVIGKQDFAQVEKRFLDMGFTCAFPPNTLPETVIKALRSILEEKGQRLSEAGIVDGILAAPIPR